MEFKDYYKAIGVQPTATAEEIKRAYRRLARKFHPDVSSEPDAEAQFKALGEAYEVLRDPQKRAQYDQLRAGGFRGGQDFRPPPGWRANFDAAGFEPGAGHAHDAADGFSDFFESLFGRGAARTGSRPRRGQDLRAQVSVDLETAFRGGTQRVSLMHHEVDADGKIVRRTRALEVQLPAGVSDGQQIRLSGQGEPAPENGQPGDLYLEIRLNPHRLFAVEGRNVHLALPVAPWEAGLGAQVQVPTLGGPVSLRIPAGSVSGKRLRLKGRGLPGNPSGDQYVTLQVVAPAANNAAKREVYERMQQVFDFNPRAHLES